MKQERIMNRGLVLIVSLSVLVLCSAWTYPVSGVNYPSTGKAHDQVEANACSPSETTECYAISTVYTNVVMWVYPTDGALYNPHFIASYALLLQEDCHESEISEACGYLANQLSYLMSNDQAPRTGLSVWPVWNNTADAMVQAEIAWLLDQEHYAYGGSSSYATYSNRAGAAFDWSYGNGGVAHDYDSSHYWYIAKGVGETYVRYALNVMNKALVHLADLCTLRGGSWCTRLDRGVKTLATTGRYWVSVDDFECINCVPLGETDPVHDWSYHRIATSYVNASCHYHKLNYETLDRLVNRNVWGASTLDDWADRWKAAHNGAVSAGICDFLGFFDGFESGDTSAWSSTVP